MLGTNVCSLGAKYVFELNVQIIGGLVSKLANGRDDYSAHEANLVYTIDDNSTSNHTNHTNVYQTKLCTCQKAVANHFVYWLAESACTLPS